MKHLATWLFLLLIFQPAIGYAETVYVIDKLRVGLRADLSEGSAVVKTVRSGMALEVLERYENFVRVRDQQGIEGWIDGRYITPDLPALLQVKQLKDKLNKTRAQLSKARAKLKETEAALVREKAKVKKLGEISSEAESAPNPVAGETADQTKSATSDKPPSDEDSGSLFMWLGISFAMLVVGFIAGIIWLRESIRKRSGGMYLRV